MSTIPTGQLGAPPHVLGLPEKFTDFREQQEFAVTEIMESYEESRIVAPCAPTGVGKTLIYMTIAVLSNWRTLALTGTKALQDQLHDDFGEIGLVTIKGKNAYDCPWLKDRLRSSRDQSCEHGSAARCPLVRSGKCPHTRAMKSASSARYVSANYSVWMALEEFTEGLGRFDLIVLDEAHTAHDWVCAHLATDWRGTDDNAMHQLFDRTVPTPVSDTYKPWSEWADIWSPRVNAERESLRKNLLDDPSDSDLVELLVASQRVARKLLRLTHLSPDWIVEKMTPYRRESYWSFQPAWGGEFVEPYLIVGVEHVLATSATLSPKTVRLLGYSDDEFTQLDYDPVFPWARGPLYHVRTCRVDNRMSSDDWGFLLDTMSAVEEARNDRKGLIHTVSYQRRDQIMKELGRPHWATHSSSRDLDPALSLFFNREDPGVFISPSVAMGYDFRFRRAEYQIIPKIPFPDTRNKLLKRRTKDDPEYGIYLAFQSLEQMAGRVMRDNRDRGETIILDDHILWFAYRYSHLGSAHFRVKHLDDIPNPPPTLVSEGIDTDLELSRLTR